jgi:hypothetical protein
MWLGKPHTLLVRVYSAAAVEDDNQTLHSTPSHCAPKEIRICPHTDPHVSTFMFVFIMLHL